MESEEKFIMGEFLNLTILSQQSSPINIKIYFFEKATSKLYEFEGVSFVNSWSRTHISVHLVEVFTISIWRSLRLELHLPESIDGSSLRISQYYFFFLEIL